MIEDDQVGTALRAPRRDLCDLAAAGEQPCVGPVTAGGDDVGDFGACRARERLELGDSLSRLAVTQVELDQQRAVAAGWTFKHCASRGPSRGSGAQPA